MMLKRPAIRNEMIPMSEMRKHVEMQMNALTRRTCVDHDHRIKMLANKRCKSRERNPMQPALFWQMEI